LRICVLLSYYAASSGNSSPSFRDPYRPFEASVPKGRSGIATTRCVTTQKNAVLIYFAAEASNHAVPNFLIFYFILITT